MKRIRTAGIAIAAAATLATAPVAMAVPLTAAQVVPTGVTGPAGGLGLDAWDHGRRHRDRDDRYGYRESRYYGDRVHRDTRVWRGRDGRYYCRKDNGTTGLLIGGAVGGLIGNEIAGRGDRTLGTILGVAGGALLGREIDRGGSRCR